MEYLFNSRGRHIANFVGQQLHAPTGENIGHYLSDPGIFIDMSGRYLGQIVQGNRLMFNRSSPSIYGCGARPRNFRTEGQARA
jgi:hypothetical protein